MDWGRRPEIKVPPNLQVHHYFPPVSPGLDAKSTKPRNARQVQRERPQEELLGGVRRGLARSRQSQGKALFSKCSLSSLLSQRQPNRSDHGSTVTEGQPAGHLILWGRAALLSDQRSSGWIPTALFLFRPPGTWAQMKMWSRQVCGRAGKHSLDLWPHQEGESGTRKCWTDGGGEGDQESEPIKLWIKLGHVRVWPKSVNPRLWALEPVTGWCACGTNLNSSAKAWKRDWLWEP